MFFFSAQGSENLEWPRLISQGALPTLESTLGGLDEDYVSHRRHRENHAHRYLSPALRNTTIPHYIAPRAVRHARAMVYSGSPGHSNTQEHGFTSLASYHTATMPTPHYTVSRASEHPRPLPFPRYSSSQAHSAQSAYPVYGEDFGHSAYAEYGPDAGYGGDPRHDPRYGPDAGYSADRRDEQVWLVISTEDAC
jgi:hypothetical protein